MTAPTSQLRRALGLPTVVATSTGLAFAALEYLAAASLVAYVAGDAAWIPIGVAGLLALLAWASFGELNGLFPTAAAIRLYMQRSMDDRSAMTVTLTYMTTIVLVIAADAFIVGSAIAHVFGESRWLAGVWITILLVIAMTANLRGIKVAGRLQDSATVIILIATTVVAITAIARSHTALRTPLNPIHGHSPGNLIEAVALGVFLYSAFEWVTTSAEEVREPRNIARGMLISLGLLFVVCALVTVAMSHVLPHHQLVSAYPQLFLGRAAFGQAGSWLMAAITAITALNTFNGGFITASRFIYATAREGSLPASLAKLNSRAVPYVPVLGLGVLSLLVAVVIEATSAWQVLVAVGAALEAMIYTIAAFCVIRLRKREPASVRPFRFRGAPALAWVAMVIFGILAVIASVSVGTHTSAAPLAVIGVCGIIAFSYVQWIMPGVRAKHLARNSARPKRRPTRPANVEPTTELAP